MNCWNLDKTMWWIVWMKQCNWKELFLNKVVVMIFAARNTHGRKLKIQYSKQSWCQNPRRSSIYGVFSRRDTFEFSLISLHMTLKTPEYFLKVTQSKLVSLLSDRIQNSPERLWKVIKKQRKVWWLNNLYGLQIFKNSENFLIPLYESKEYYFIIKIGARFIPYPLPLMELAWCNAESE